MVLALLALHRPVDPWRCLWPPWRWGRGCTWLSFAMLCLAMLYLVCLQSGLLLHLGPRGPDVPSISRATVFQGTQNTSRADRTLRRLPAGPGSSISGSTARSPARGSSFSNIRSFWRRLKEMLTGFQLHRTAFQPSSIEMLLPWSAWQKELSSRLLSPRLQHVFRNYQAMNKYRVPPGAGQHRGHPPLTRMQLLCQLKHRVDVSTLLGDEGPFAAPEWKGVLPRRSLAEDLGPLAKCAVVSSAGSMLGSGLGKEIGEWLLRGS